MTAVIEVDAGTWIPITIAVDGDVAVGAYRYGDGLRVGVSHIQVVGVEAVQFSR